MAAEQEEIQQRYDRQVRLWGQEAQRSLCGARVAVGGADGAGSEIAKNLVLVGVGAVTLCDRAVCAAADLRTNHFVHAEDVAAGARRGAVTAQRLQQINPFVNVTATASDSEDESSWVAGHNVLVVRADCRDALQSWAAEAAASSVELLVTVSQFGSAALAVFHPKPAADGVDSFLAAASLASYPRPVQIVALALRCIAPAMPFAARLRALIAARDATGASLVTDDDLQALLDSGATTAVDSTLVGAAVAQQLIARIGGGSNAPKVFRWLAVSVEGGDVRCYVGDD